MQDSRIEEEHSDASNEAWAEGQVDELNFSEREEGEYQPIRKEREKEREAGEKDKRRPSEPPTPRTTKKNRTAFTPPGIAVSNQVAHLDIDCLYGKVMLSEVSYEMARELPAKLLKNKIIINLQTAKRDSRGFWTAHINDENSERNWEKEKENWQGGGKVVTYIPEEGTKVCIYAVGNDLLYLNLEMLHSLTAQVGIFEPEATVGEADNHKILEHRWGVWFSNPDEAHQFCTKSQKGLVLDDQYVRANLWYNPNRPRSTIFCRNFEVGATCENTQTLLEKMDLEVLTVTMDPKCTSAPAYHIITMKDEKEARRLMSLAAKSNPPLLLSYKIPINKFHTSQGRDSRWDPNFSSSQRRRVKKKSKGQQGKEKKRRPYRKELTKRSWTNKSGIETRPPRLEMIRPMNKVFSRLDGKKRKLGSNHLHKTLFLLKLILIFTISINFTPTTISEKKNLQQVKSHNKHPSLLTHDISPNITQFQYPTKGTGQTTGLAEKSRLKVYTFPGKTTKKGIENLPKKEYIEKEKRKRKRKPHLHPTLLSLANFFIFSTFTKLRLLFHKKSYPTNRDSNIDLERKKPGLQRDFVAIDLVFFPIPYLPKLIEKIQIKYYPDNTVSNIMDNIEKGLEYPMGNMKLVYNNKTLSPYTLMKTHNIPNGAIVEVHPNSTQTPIPIFVDNCPLPTKILYVDPLATIQSITQRIETTHYIKKEDFYLEHQGKYLKENTNIKQYNIIPYTTIRMIHKGRESTQQFQDKIEIKIATINLGCQPKNYSILEEEASQKGYSIIAIQETGCTASEIGPPQPEKYIKLKDYRAIWNNPPVETLLKNSKRNSLQKTQDNPTLTLAEKRKKIRHIEGKQKVKSRGGTGFLIHKSIERSCYFKRYNKIKPNGKTTLNTRMHLLKIKIEGEPTLLILNLYLPASGRAANEKFCNRYVLPLLQKWETKQKLITILGDMNTKLKNADRWSTKPTKNYTLKHSMFIQLLQQKNWKDLYNTFSKALKFTRHINKLGHEIHTRIDHVLVSPSMRKLYTDCDIIEDHELNTDHNWVVATIEMNPQITDETYLTVDEGSNTRIYKDKNLSEETKNKLIEELNWKWPHIQLKLEPLNNHTLQKNYITITKGITDCCDKILKKKGNSKTKNTHTPYTGNKELGQLKKLKKTIIKNRRKVLTALQTGTPLQEITHIDTSYSVFVTNKKGFLEEITQTMWTPQTVMDPKLWLLTTKQDLDKINTIKEKLIKKMDNSKIETAIKNFSNSFKRGLKYFWSKVTGKQDTKKNITSVEYRL